MENLIEYLRQHQINSLGPKVSAKDLADFQTQMFQAGLPTLPFEYTDFLKAINGLKSDETVILGIGLKNTNFDLFKFNKKFNKNSDSLILAYDDMTFLLYNKAEKKYVLIDRDWSDAFEEFTNNELEFALISIIHLDNE